MIEKFSPNEFEFKIFSFQDGFISYSEVIEIILNKTLFLPSTMTNEYDKPYFICPGEDGERRIAIFTSKRLLLFSALLMKAIHDDNYPKINSCFEISGREMLNKLPKKHGLLINPGFYIQFIITYREVKRLKKLYDIPKMDRFSMF